MTNMTEIEPIALFDMDGTLCDYDKGLFEELESIRSPSEPVFNPPVRDNVPEYVKKRRNLITASSVWWESLPKLKLGWDILDVAKKLGFRVMILTQGPRKNPESWKGKKKWIDKNLGEDTDITITRDKGLVYGKVLVDDFPEYIERWLSWRERGLVIMPANESNKDFVHPQVIRYDGTNLDQVEKAMLSVRDRKRGESLSLN
ncbi:5' nucleotidase, deoxy (Pyrimidine), cytosolic type C protein (NT5C) [uncultured archaeon]|nr:5' nucleotidase, deoxy (Pyrimidine), cytosolic type C protein (NT5C) [uncultured archaeon]